MAWTVEIRNECPEIKIKSYNEIERPNVIRFVNKHCKDLKKLGIKKIIHHTTKPKSLEPNTLTIYATFDSTGEKTIIKLRVDDELYRIIEKVSADIDFVYPSLPTVIYINNRPFLSYDKDTNSFTVADITHRYIPEKSEKTWRFAIMLMYMLKGEIKLEELFNEKIDVEDVRMLTSADFLSSIIGLDEYIQLIPIKFKHRGVLFDIKNNTISLIAEGRTKHEKLRVEKCYDGEISFPHEVYAKVSITYKYNPKINKLMYKDIYAEGYIIADDEKIPHPNISHYSNTPCVGFTPKDIDLNDITDTDNLADILIEKSRILSILMSLLNQHRLDNDTDRYGGHLFRYLIKKGLLPCNDEDEEDEEDTW